MAQIDPKRVEALGPAERTIQTLLGLTSHMAHGRPGLVTKSADAVGFKWEPCTWKQEGDDKVVYLVPLAKGASKAKTPPVKVGILRGETDVVAPDGKIVGSYRRPSANSKIFQEVAVHLYREIAAIWKMDNTFAAHWASYAFAQDNKDLKVALAAFLLVQNRCGAPVVEEGQVIFYDDDLRDVGEAMFLIKGNGNQSMDPKLLLRVGDLLRLPGIVEVNRDLGFGRSGTAPIMGRYAKAVTRWLEYRERNPKMLEGLVKAGMRSLVMDLARRVHYKPLTEGFYEVLRWKQKQAKDGRRTLAIGKEVKAAETWEGLSEAEICQKISETKPGYKRLVGLLPKSIGLTQAIMASVMEAGILSPKDLILMTPTLEDLGLLTREPYKTLWKAALDKAEDQRALNVARNVKTAVVKEGLEDAADKAMSKALEAATRGLRVYCMVDKSGSMDRALDGAIDYLTHFLGGFPLDRLHVSLFNTMGVEITIQAPKRAAVVHAFKGHSAGGGTSYSQGVLALQKHKPKPEEDVLFIFVGDEVGEPAAYFAQCIQATKLNPVAFGFMKVGGDGYGGGNTVTGAAAILGIPCFNVNTKMFDSDDPYAVTRILRDLIAATPVGKTTTPLVAPKRVTLVEQILQTPLLQVPAWAA